MGVGVGRRFVRFLVQYLHPYEGHVNPYNGNSTMTRFVFGPGRVEFPRSWAGVLCEAISTFGELESVCICELTSFC